MIDLLLPLTLGLGLAVLVLGFVKLAYLPLSAVFELRAAHRARHPRPTLLDQQPLVSIVVPAYNEGVVLETCVRSLAAVDYPRTEVLVVDDGSTDNTPEVMAELGREFPQIRMIRQANAGKGAALNHGAALSSGEVLVFVDADSLFQADTIERMLEGFDEEKVGAVCGDDRPVNLDRLLTRLLTVISHIGTGLVRRSLSLLGCLPIVSGNAGAFRREVFEEVGGFDENTVGEDLELTWRVHRAGRQVRFAPRALVLAESPSTLKGLWKQRVRWARGLLETSLKHAGVIGNPHYGAFGLYLLFNTLTMIAMPVVQLALLLLLPVLMVGGEDVLPRGTWAWLGWLGLVLTAVIALVAIGLNRAWADLRHLWTLPLWPLYSVFIGLTMVHALGLQATRRPATWNKLERTGVVGQGRPQHSGTGTLSQPEQVGGIVSVGSVAPS